MSERENQGGQRGWRITPELCLVVLLHLLTLLGLILYRPTWERLSLFLALLFVGGVLGAALTYHRCLAHRSFAFRNKWLERVFATFATLVFSHGPLSWVSAHRLHHRYTDTTGDPHDSHRGFWHAHFLWIFKPDPRWDKKAKVYDQERVPDIASDPYYRWLSNYFYLPPLTFLALLYVFGSWPWFFWGGLIPTVAYWHIQWSVNSLAHRFGYRNFSIPDHSTNFWPVALLTCGDGWHNNHHAFPYSAKHGFFRWWELDVTYLLILLLKRLGLVHHLRNVSEKQLKFALASNSSR